MTPFITRTKIRPLSTAYPDIFTVDDYLCAAFLRVSRSFSEEELRVMTLRLGPLMMDSKRAVELEIAEFNRRLANRTQGAWESWFAIGDQLH